MERVTRDATLSHFLLMFGYKMFSFYFPLFLVERGWSIPQVGYIYLFIYLPITISAPFVGILNHKVNPVLLTALGIGGYGLYSFGMMLIENPFLFFLWQILLGVSAALFFVSLEGTLMNAHLKNPDGAFAWFFSAPFYVDAVAPVLGALLI